MILGIFLLWPVFVSIFLTMRRKDLDDEKFKYRFESIYLGNKTDTYLGGLKLNKSLCFCYATFFCLRRIVLVFCFFYLKEDDYMQCIYGLIAIQVCYVSYLV